MCAACKVESVSVSKRNKLGASRFRILLILKYCYNNLFDCF